MSRSPPPPDLAATSDSSEADAQFTSARASHAGENGIANGTSARPEAPPEEYTNPKVRLLLRRTTASGSVQYRILYEGATKMITATTSTILDHVTPAELQKFEHHSFLMNYNMETDDDGFTIGGTSSSLLQQHDNLVRMAIDPKTTDAKLLSALDELRDFQPEAELPNNKRRKRASSSPKEYRKKPRLAAATQFDDSANVSTDSGTSTPRHTPKSSKTSESKNNGSRNAAVKKNGSRKKDKGKGKAIEVIDLDQDEDEEEEGPEEFEIEAIVGHRINEPRGSIKEYEVKWVGYDAKEDNTWEPVENLAAAAAAVEEYESKLDRTVESNLLFLSL